MEQFPLAESQKERKGRRLQASLHVAPQSSRACFWSSAEHAPLKKVNQESQSAIYCSNLGRHDVQAKRSSDQDLHTA